MLFIGICVFGSPAAMLVSGVIFALICITISFLGCPHCGRHVGYTTWGVFYFLWPFGGWCIHCHNRLFNVTDAGDRGA